MTRNTIKDPPLDARPGTAIERSIAKTPPAAAVPRASGHDLESRIRERRAELMNKLRSLGGDVRPQAIESRDRLKAKLSELAHIVRWGVVDGWAGLGAPLTNKLEQWIAESASHLVAKEEQP